MSVLEDLRQLEEQVARRLRELEPMVEEYRDLEKIAQRLGLGGGSQETVTAADGATDAPQPAPRRRRAAPKPSRARAGSRGKRTRQPAAGVTPAIADVTADAPAAPAAADAPLAAADALSEAAAALVGADAPADAAAAPAAPTAPADGATDAPSAKRASAASRARTATRARRSAVSPGTRQRQVLELIDQRPGITVPELGKEIGVDPTGLYRVVRGLERDGRVRKDGMALHPAGS